MQRRGAGPRLRGCDGSEIDVVLPGEADAAVEWRRRPRFSLMLAYAFAITAPVRPDAEHSVVYAPDHSQGLWPRISASFSAYKSRVDSLGERL
jgi:hypothetical protein